MSFQPKNSFAHISAQLEEVVTSFRVFNLTGTAVLFSTIFFHVTTFDQITALKNVFVATLRNTLPIDKTLYLVKSKDFLTVFLYFYETAVKCMLF